MPSPAEPDTLGARLRTVRELAHLGTRELDRLAGLAKGHTYAIESGSRPNVEARTADALARVLGASLDWLVSGRGRAPSARSVQSAVRAAREAAAARVA